MEEVQTALHKMEQAASMLESEDSFRFEEIIVKKEFE